MFDLVPQQWPSPPPVSSRQRPSTRLQRATADAVHVQHANGVVRAARVDAVDYVTGRALQAIESLTNMETLAIGRNPLGEGRYRAIVDTATAGLAQIVADTARGR